MKKILFGILTFLGVGLSFCSADNQCVSGVTGVSYGNSYGSTKIGFMFQLSNSSSQYTFNSFSIGYLNEISSLTLKVCYTNNSSPNRPYINWNTISSYFTCEDVSYSYVTNSYNNYTITLDTPYSLSAGTTYFSFVLFYNSSMQKYLPGGNDIETVPLSSDINAFFNRRLFQSFPLTNVCYSSLSPTGKLKINYGSTSSTFEIANGDFIVNLESPVNVSQDGHTYSYNGSTGLNLFYNGTTQRYNKSELYLYTPSYFSNNIFTPICL